jgi:hypothetical protein|nr:multiubiquitin domain-containing protein [uncultured Brevundimonas sp.]
MEAEDNGRAWRVVDLNGSSHENEDPILSGREVLAFGGFAPATEHVLVEIWKGRTRLVGADDKVDLKARPGARFRSAQGDRAFTFTFDEIGQVWCEETIEVNELAAIFTVPADKEMVLERDDQPDVVLRTDGSVSFGPSGVEDIVTRNRRDHDFVTVTVFATAGVFPAEGALRVKADTLVSDVLERAARKLHLTDTAAWIVSIDGRDINVALSFEQNGLSGHVDLDWLPPEGGGGDA